MKKISNSDLKRNSLKEYKNKEKEPIIIVLDNVRSAFNIGSIFRTCDAFNIEKIYLCGISAIPPQKDILKTALGATESVEWEHIADIEKCINNLKLNGYEIIGVEQLDKSISLNEFKNKENKKIALIFGNEINGLSDNILNLLDMGIEIPQFGTKHSFNITISVGIVLYQIVCNNSK